MQLPDGCTTMQMLTKILIPLLKPALAATGIYAFISSWNEFAIANVPTRSETSRTVPLALSEFASFYRVDWGQTMAAAMIITLPLLLFLCLFRNNLLKVLQVEL
ncbi:MAG: ABC transporter permease subunit [Ruminococcus sp.]